VTEDTTGQPRSDETKSAESPVSQSMPPRRIGKYRILEKIGEGGMGEVYLAEQEDPRRRVALKIIKWGMDTKQVIARFEVERQALALMDHPNIAKVFDAGATEQGRPYFVMEHVKGVRITEHCDTHRLTTSERLGLFTQVCEGIQHAHQKAVIHRDIKPSNVLVAIQDGKPVPKIIDFGVAKATAQRLTEKTIFTAMGVMVGTPEYMSPEQANLTGQDVDIRTDVYSLGVLLYELLVGVLPFDPKTLRQAGFDEIRRKIREDIPARPSTRLTSLRDDSIESATKRRTDVRVLLGQLRGDLDWIAMKALEKDRARRYQSSSELSADIKRHMMDEPVLAGPPNVLYRFSKRIRRHRVSLQWFMLGTILAAIVAGSAAVLVTLSPKQQGPGVVVGRSTKLVFTDGLELDPALSPDGTMLAYAAGPLDRTRIFIRRLSDGSEVCVSGELPGYQRWPRWSPDGGKIVFQSSDPGQESSPMDVTGQLYIVSSAGGEPRAVSPPFDGGAASPTWSPDGEYIGFVSGDSIYRQRADGTQLELVAKAATPHSLSWSPSGKWLAFVSGFQEYALGREGTFGNYSPGSIWVVSMESKEPSRVTTGEYLFASPVWGPDDRTLLYVSDVGGSRDIHAVVLDSVGNVENGPTRLTTGLDAHSMTIALDGRRLAYARMTINSNVWSLDIPEPGGTPSLPVQRTFGTQNIEAVDVSPDGLWLAFSAEIAGGSEVFKMNLDEGEYVQLTQHSSGDFLPSWSPDGSEVAFHSFRTGNRDVFVMAAEGGQPRQVTHDPIHEWARGWAPDGNALLISTTKGRYLLTRDRHTGEWVHGRNIDVAAHSLLSDGRILFTSDGCLRVGLRDGTELKSVICSGDLPGAPVLVNASWSGRGDDVCLKTVDAERRSAFWLVSIAKRSLRLIGSFEDPAFQPFRHSHSLDDRRLYFLSGHRESDIWSLELKWNSVGN